MKNLVNASILVMIFIVDVCGTIKVCYSRFNTTTFRVHISSQHKETNMWNIMTYADRLDPKGLDPRSKRVVMDVVHSTRLENGLLNSRLSAIAVLNMAPDFSTHLSRLPESLLASTVGVYRTKP
ncbi:uncharacterized protein [Anabrus simplex]|uniref:uncharacterized protein n=1 Tax=Anabrus simplex TaxID=316456 RepID=UPI0035A27D6F